MTDPQETNVRRILDGVKGIDDVALVCRMAGYKEESAPYRALNLELLRRLKRREQKVAWTAIGISAAALLVSIATAYLRFYG